MSAPKSTYDLGTEWIRLLEAGYDQFDDEGELVFEPGGPGGTNRYDGAGRRLLSGEPRAV